MNESKEDVQQTSDDTKRDQVLKKMLGTPPKPKKMEKPPKRDAN